ncbi:MAG: hypothetical protein OXQ29_00750 [Rhodospirillaceae bacterium]|nr:hypothetical protein [Rhodospirillaceae bacterium]
MTERVYHCEVRVGPLAGDVFTVCSSTASGAAIEALRVSDVARTERIRIVMVSAEEAWDVRITLVDTGGIWRFRLCLD